MSAIRLDRSKHPCSPAHMHQLLRGWRHSEAITSSTELSRAKGHPGSFLSVVVPAKNEAGSLAQLVDEITRALRPRRHCLGGPDDFEIIIVDDGSTDATREVLGDLVSQYRELSGLLLATQVGQSAATLAGIRAANGCWIATLDADLQNDPAELITLWTALPGNDAVLGWRVARQDSWTRRLTSYWANKVRNVVLGQAVRDTGCSIRIFPRAVALRMPTFYGMHRFFGSLLLREGCQLVQVPVRHRPRFHGRSHYTLWNRLLPALVDLVGVAWLMRRRMHYKVVSHHGVPAIIDTDTPDTTKHTSLPRYVSANAGRFE